MDLTLASLKLKNIIGIKDATGDVSRVSDTENTVVKILFNYLVKVSARLTHG